MGFLEEEELAELAGRLAPDVDGDLIEDPDEEDDEPDIDPDLQAAVLARLGVVADEDDDEEHARVLAAMDIPGDEFERYWTRGKGLGRWAASVHPWRTLVRLLRKHRGIRDPKGLASHYFHVVFGIWPGERKGSNPVGPG